MGSSGDMTQGARAAQWDEDRNTVLGKAFVILGAFDADAGTLTLSELTDRSRLPKSTVHRVAEALIEVGALERVDGGFQLGTRLFELGELVPRKRTLRRIALPYMQDLYEATHETVHLAVPDGTDVLYLDKISGHRTSDAPSRIGGRMPLYCTGVGKAILAFSSPSLLESVLEVGLERLSPYTITVPDVLRQNLTTIRERGVAFDHEESQVGISCAAAPILYQDRGAIGSVSVTGPTARVNLPRLAPAVQTAALAISRATSASVPPNLDADAG